MNIITLTAVPVSTYTTKSNGQEITMISQVFGVKALAQTALENTNLAWLRSFFSTFKENCIKQHGDKAFAITCRVAGRKPCGFDKAKHEFNYTHIAA
jgi:hypothetical protein